MALSLALAGLNKSRGSLVISGGGRLAILRSKGLIKSYSKGLVKSYSEESGKLPSNRSEKGNRKALRLNRASPRSRLLLSKGVILA